MKKEKCSKCSKEKNQIDLKQGFTLIELLVVIVIIGILAAIALPQYKEAVEKSIMQEAIMNLRTIASANERFYLINNRYATVYEMDKLDIEIHGEIKTQTGLEGKRIMTKYFIYSPHLGIDIKAIAHRVKEGVTDYQKEGPYILFISSNNNQLWCSSRSTITATQKKLCDKIARDHQL